MKTALLFPGQGSQHIGMGKDLYDAFTEAKEVFQEVDDVLNRRLSKIIFEGESETLVETTNAQPAIMAVSMAIFKVLKKQGGFRFDFACGHSLGEYSALGSTDSLTLADTTSLLKVRSEAMAAVNGNARGGMLALLGASFEDAQRLCDHLSNEGVIVIANDNGAGQVVLSGQIELIEKAQQLSKEFNIKRAIMLKVSQAFHSPLMNGAAEIMKDALASAGIKAPLVPVLPNVTAFPTSEVEEIRECLYSQVCGRVRFRETVNQLELLSVQRFIEVGPGSVLSNLVKQMLPQAVTMKVSNLTEIDQILAQ